MLHREASGSVCVCVCCRIDSNAGTEDVRYMVFSPLFRKGSPEKRTEKGTNSDELCILIEIFEWNNISNYLPEKMLYTSNKNQTVDYLKLLWGWGDGSVLSGTQRSHRGSESMPGISVGWRTTISISTRTINACPCVHITHTHQWNIFKCLLRIILRWVR